MSLIIVSLVLAYGGRSDGHTHAREPVGVTSCYPTLQDGGANRWQVNTGWCGKMQKVSMYPSGPFNGQNFGYDAIHSQIVICFLK